MYTVLGEIEGERMLNSLKHAIPYVCTALNAVAGIIYLCAGDKPRAAYWLSAAVLTFSTTRMS